MKSKIIASTVLLTAVLSASAFSGKGSGTEKNPYQITNAEELFEVRGNLSASYRLMNDIDLEEFIAEDNPTQGWSPIGNVTTPFNGNFDGNNKVIKGLYINRPTEDNVGLFGCVEKAYIHNVGILNARVTGNDNTGALVGTIGFRTIYGFSNRICDVVVNGGIIEGKNNVGGIAGMINNIGKITVPYDIMSFRTFIKGCSVNARIGASVSDAGGICGKFISGIYYFINSYTSKRYNMVSAIEDNLIECEIVSQGNAGGVSAQIEPIGKISYELRRNIVKGSISGNGSVCGILGSIEEAEFETPVFENNVSAPDTISNAANEIYRLSPEDFPNNYAYSGTLAFVNGMPIEMEDNEKNGQSFGLKTLKRKSTYEGMGFDFGTRWAIKDNESFPYGINQSEMPEVTEFVSGSRASISGKASGAGNVYVYIGGNLYESYVVDGEWKVELGNVTEGTEAQVSVATGGKLPSVLVTAEAKKTTVEPEGKAGDANGDGVLDAADVVGVVNYIIGKPSAAFNAANADVTGDGQVLVDDAVGVVELIMNAQ